MVGETPSDFVKRLRLERAIYLMSFGKKKSLTAIAIDCGFASSSDFTRSFKQRYGVAPSKFDKQSLHSDQAKRIEASTIDSPFRLEKQPPRTNPDQFRVRVRELPARSVAYIRVANPYQGNGVVEAAMRLQLWAKANHHDDGQWLGYQFENPKVTELAACYYCVAVEVSTSVEPVGEIGIYRFPKMLVAEVAMKGDIHLEIRLFQWLYGSWLPRSQYVPADQPCFEAWNGKPFQNGFEHFELAIQLPIK